jgi:NAD(P)-dependent dehydrogenase (short-subunit alcohol dehydrogenase family)
MAVLSDKALAGRTIVVTGAARGIGAGIVEAALNAGGAVVLLDLDRQLAEETARRLDPSGSRTFVSAADVAAPDSLAKAAEEAAAQLGYLSGWVNNAGIVQMIPAKDVTPNAWPPRI